MAIKILFRAHWRRISVKHPNIFNPCVQNVARIQMAKFIPKAASYKDSGINKIISYGAPFSSTCLVLYSYYADTE